MDKSVLRIVLNMILTITIVIISIPLWSYTGNQKGLILASGYNDIPIEIVIGNFDPLIITQDDRAFGNIEATDISFKNPNDFLKKFDIFLLVDKTSTVPYDYLKISVNDQIYPLTSLKSDEDEDNYYFLLDQTTLNAYSKNTYSIRLWLDENIGDIGEDSKLITNFITK